ncbi:MAG: R2-like ligand-binding oxidase [Sporolactobacillus laevolacticus]|nr:R2-like ligand-binding oxidase [Sporolactobacillus laevolacticus]
MFSNTNPSSFQADASAFQPSAAPRGRIDQQDAFGFQNDPAEQPFGYSADTAFPFPQSQGTGDPYMENSFNWEGSASTSDGRQLQQPPRPPQPPFNPQQFERRLRQLERQQQQFERQLRQVERQQELFQRELQSLDRRVRAIERRLGFPIPPIGGPGGPGFPPR